MFSFSPYSFYPFFLFFFPIDINLFTVWNELENQSMKAIKGVMKISTALLLAFYIIFSTVSYLYFYSSEYGDKIINLFADNDYLFQIGKALLMVVLAAASAFLVFPIRSEIDLSFFPTSQPMTRTRRVVESALTLALPFLFSLCPSDVLTRALGAITGAIICIRFARRHAGISRSCFTPDCSASLCMSV